MGVGTAQAKNEEQIRTLQIKLSQICAGAWVFQTVNGQVIRLMTGGALPSFRTWF